MPPCATPCRTSRAPSRCCWCFRPATPAAATTDGTGGNADTIQSPATAKNVITVGAIEQLRNITNQVWNCTTVSGTNHVRHQPAVAGHDRFQQPGGRLLQPRQLSASASKGKYGRFKPDVVAPGTFVISTRSGQWDTNAYYNPTSHLSTASIRHVCWSRPTRFWVNSIFVPDNAVQLNLSVLPNTNSPVPFPDLPLYVRQSAPSDQRRRRV